MIEYLYDAIRVSAGTEAVISAKITDNLDYPITEDCRLVIHLDNSMITVAGEYVDDTWYFTISADATKDLSGRYWYCFRHEQEQLCFMQPIYFV